MSRSFAIIEPARNPRVFVLVMTAVPVLVAAVAVYAIAGRALPPFVPVLLLAAPVLPHLLISRWIDRRQVALDGDRLGIRAAMVTHSVAVADIDLEHARVLRLDEHVEWRPFLRTGGLGMPGLKLGWFRTRNLTRLLCVLTDANRTLLLPLRDGKQALLLSVSDPNALLSALREARPPRRA